MAVLSQKLRTDGLRPVHLRHDLLEIADLIETCFASTLDTAGRSAIQEMRSMGRAGPLLWALGRVGSAIPAAMRGYVWVERDHVIGNVSLTPAGYGQGWVIANVAVSPDHRRHGIARQLMRATMDEVATRGRFAVLQVEADNMHARELYEELGFTELRTFTRWRHATHHFVPAAPPESPELQSLTAVHAAALYALAAQIRPNERGGLGWLRQTEKREFNASQWMGLKPLATGRNVQHWVLPGAGNAIDAALTAEVRLGLRTALIDLYVRPERQGLESGLLNGALRRLGARHRPVVAEHPSDDEVANAAFRYNHFMPERTLVHMIWRVPPKP
ncbi:GNAT family N-acetyltransferase [Aggregatilinea lenta]|uniref:GNAT family N-acetyltransferase n=1 Tax=Aggregatilinea lenta TaxID=913108 RepID=UPI000E5B39EB|nr:GNAT family N-acetyltransferase [Aggregatilinea lenta]